MGDKWLDFSYYEQATAKKPIKREKFLAEMEAVVPSAPPPHHADHPRYPKSDIQGVRPTYPLAS
jgi:transposase, IS5 family